MAKDVEKVPEQDHEERFKQIVRRLVTTPPKHKPNKPKRSSRGAPSRRDQKAE